MKGLAICLLVLLAVMPLDRQWFFQSAETRHDKPAGVALASGQPGILGSKAPEIHLDTWIDGQGRPIPPVHLRNYRGKVVYLYFFQDW